MADREMDPGDGGAAAITAGLLVVALIVIGFFFFFGIGGPSANVIDLDARPAAVGSAPLATGAAPVHLVHLER